MPTPAERIYASVERVIFNPIGLLFIIGVIVVVVNLLMGTRPDTPKPLELNDTETTVNEATVKDEG